MVLKGVTALDVVSYKEQGATVKGMGADHICCLTLATRQIYTSRWTSTKRRGIGAEPSAAAVPAVELSPLHPFETL